MSCYFGHNSLSLPKIITMAVKTKTRSVLKKYENQSDNRFWLVEESAAGFPVTGVFDLMEVTHFNKEFFAGILNLSTKTLDRYRKAEKRLTPSSSELILKLIVLYKKGEDLFGRMDEFQKWIEEPSFGLGNKVPKTMLGTPAGIDLILDELTRIEYGDLA